MKDKKMQIRINEIFEDVQKQLSNLETDLKNNSLRKNDVWNAYAKLEYVILLAKLEHGFETPGGFEYNKFDEVNEEKILELVIHYLESGKKAFKKGSMKSAINDLRKARDALKLLFLKH